MTTHSSIFNSLFNSDGPLEFREPSLASKIERQKGGEIFIPSYPLDVYSWQLSKPKKSPTMYRNIIAWYLKAAGLTGREIGEFLSISASRANQIALRTQKQIFKEYGSIANMGLLTKPEKQELEGEILAAHMFRGVRREMIAAEYALDRCIEQDLFVSSGALRIGRERYMAAYDKVAGTRCPCRYCTIFTKEDMGPYWTKDSEGKADDENKSA